MDCYEFVPHLPECYTFTSDLDIDCYTFISNMRELPEIEPEPEPIPDEADVPGYQGGDIFDILYITGAFEILVVLGKFGEDKSPAISLHLMQTYLGSSGGIQGIEPPYSVINLSQIQDGDRLEQHSQGSYMFALIADEKAHYFDVNLPEFPVTIDDDHAIITPFSTDDMHYWNDALIPANGETVTDPLYTAFPRGYKKLLMIYGKEGHYGTGGGGGQCSDIWMDYYVPLYHENMRAFANAVNTNTLNGIIEAHEGEQVSVGGGMSCCGEDELLFTWQANTSANMAITETTHVDREFYSTEVPISIGSTQKTGGTMSGVDSRFLQIRENHRYMLDYIAISKEPGTPCKDVNIPYGCEIDYNIKEYDLPLYATQMCWVGDEIIGYEPIINKTGGITPGDLRTAGRFYKVDFVENKKATYGDTWISMGTAAIMHDGTTKVEGMPIGERGAMPVIIGDRAIIPATEGIFALDQSFRISENSEPAEEEDFSL